MFCMQDLTKELKQPPVVILKQVIFYKIFILWLWVKSIKRYSQDVQFMNFPSHVFFNDINHCYNAAILKKNSLWLFLFYIALATYYYSEKEHRALRSAIVSYLLKKNQVNNSDGLLLPKFQSCIYSFLWEYFSMFSSFIFKKYKNHKYQNSYLTLNYFLRRSKLLNFRKTPSLSLVLKQRNLNNKTA